MKKEYLQKTFTFLLFINNLLLLSCKEQTGKQKNNATELISDTVTKDIPEWFSNELSKPLQERFAKREKELRLTPLQFGVKGLEIRIWIECNRPDSQSLIIVTNSDQNWHAKFYSYIYKYKPSSQDDGLEIKEIENKSENKMPKSGWNVFSKELLETNIENLPDFSKLKSKYELPTDATIIEVEIATPSKYRLYEYPELDMNKTLIGGPDQFEKALSLIEKEFDYRRPCQ